MDLADIQKHLDSVMNEQNNLAIPGFEGYSPVNMHHILYFTFGADSPIQLQVLSNSDYQKIPMLNQAKFLIGLIDKAGEVKLTNKGFLPTKMVADIYQQGFIKEWLIESGISKLYKETNSMAINLTRILLELAGLTKKRKGKLSLTKLGTKIIENNDELLRLILLTFATKFNWAFYDGYGENQIGQLGYGFSLILLSKYGKERRLTSFYAEKYFKAFPQLLDGMELSSDETLENRSAGCYSLRTFNRFLNYFGLIEMDGEERGIASTEYVTKTDLFDQLIKLKS